jgi:hypothetical protein
LTSGRGDVQWKSLTQAALVMCPAFGASHDSREFSVSRVPRRGLRPRTVGNVTAGIDEIGIVTTWWLLVVSGRNNGDELGHVG